MDPDSARFSPPGRAELLEQACKLGVITGPLTHDVERQPVVVSRTRQRLVRVAQQFLGQLGFSVTDLYRLIQAPEPEVLGKPTPVQEMTIAPSMALTPIIFNPMPEPHQERGLLCLGMGLQPGSNMANRLARGAIRFEAKVGDDGDAEPAVQPLRLRRLAALLQPGCEQLHVDPSDAARSDREILPLDGLVQRVQQPSDLRIRRPLQ